MKPASLFVALGIALMPLSLGQVSAAEPDVTVEIVLRDHRFDPAEVRVPAGRAVKLVVRNEDKAAEEFESRDLNRERVIKGGTTAIMQVGPLKPGRYAFFGEFNPKTARGTLIAE